jgi:hypothetical protein
LLEFFTEMVEPLKSIEGFVPGITFQPLSVSTMKFTKSNGGNAMGLDEEDGPLTSRQSRFQLAPNYNTNRHDQKVLCSIIHFSDSRSFDRHNELGLPRG